nr:MAG TPA: hypothetical protein [Bacteriophage sp.]
MRRTCYGCMGRVQRQSQFWLNRATTVDGIFRNRNSLNRAKCVDEIDEMNFVLNVVRILGRGSIQSVSKSWVKTCVFCDNSEMLLRTVYLIATTT